MFPRPQSMDNSQTIIGDSLHLNQSTYSETLDLNGINAFVKLGGKLRGKLAHFLQQLSTFPTCTESAAILVFAFESNPTGSGEKGRWNSKNKPCRKVSLSGDKKKQFFGPNNRSSRVRGPPHVVYTLNLGGRTVPDGSWRVDWRS